MNNKQIFDKSFSKTSIRREFEKINENRNQNDKLKEDSVNFGEIHKSLLSGEHKFNKFQLKRMLKENKDVVGKTRDLFIAKNPSDFLMLSLINEYLKEFYYKNYKLKLPSVDETIDLISGKLLIDNKQKILKMDIKNFFPSINIKKLLKYMTKDGIDKRVINITKYAIYNQRKNFNISNKEVMGVPQGIPISNTLAEIYLKNFKYKNHIRYVDDILLFLPYKNLSIVKVKMFYNKAFIKLRLFALGLKLNKNKSHLKLDTNKVNFKLLFLGYSFKFKSGELVIGVSKQGLKRRVDKFNAICKKYDSKLRLLINNLNYINKSITIDAEKQKRLTKPIILKLKNETDIFISGFINHNGDKRGWFAHYNKINDINQLKLLDNINYRLFNSYENLRKTHDFHLNTNVRTYYELKKENSKYIRNYKKALINEDCLDDFLKKYLLMDRKILDKMDYKKKVNHIYDSMFFSSFFLDDVNPDYLNIEGIDLDLKSGEFK